MKDKVTEISQLVSRCREFLCMASDAEHHVRPRPEGEALLADIDALLASLPPSGTELYRPELNKNLLALVNKPVVQSLLYDLDLLPEQLTSQKEMTIGLFAAYCRLEGVLLAFALGGLPKVAAGESEETR